jgi:hypothetical protein
LSDLAMSAHDSDLHHHMQLTLVDLACIPQ